METYNKHTKILIEDIGMMWNTAHTRRRRKYKVQCPTCGIQRVVNKHNYDKNSSTRCLKCKGKKNIISKSIHQYWLRLKRTYPLSEEFHDFKIFKEWLLGTNWKQGYRFHTKDGTFSRTTEFTKNPGLLYNEFVIKANKAHNNKYIYNEVYTEIIPKTITVTCRVHGGFKANLITHAQGHQVCPECHKNVLKQRTGSYFYHDWETQGVNSSNFDSFKVYIFKLITEHGILYKIGKTFLTPIERFKHSTMPYTYNVIEYYEGPADIVSKFEQELHNMNKHTKIIPEKRFHGSNECFSSYIMPITSLSRGLSHVIIHED